MTPFPVIAGCDESHLGRFHAKNCRGVPFTATANLTSNKLRTVPSAGASAEAFNTCNKLKNVYCKATEPPRLGDAVFYNNAYGRKIYVPYESVDKYKDSYANNGWNDYEYYSAITGYLF